mgnify:CR=1 FL=1
MYQATNKRSTASILALTCMLTAGLACAQDSPPNQTASADAVAADLLVARPGGFAATVLGTAVFIVGLPFTLINGSTEQAAQKLVVEPAQYTFARPLGQDM